MPSYNESASGLMVPHSLNGHALSESRYAVQVELYEATIRDLELQVREQGWLRLDSAGAQEFTRETIGEIVATARAFYLKNPLVNRAVEIGALYVFGQDISISAADEDARAVVDRFWRLNQATLTGQQASRLLEVELEVTGNVFLAQFADAITGDLRVRAVPVEQVQGIVTNLEDRSDVWFYRRTWTQRKADGVGDDQKAAFHPDVRHNPAIKPETMTWQGKDIPIVWGAPIRHIKAGAFLHWLWGVPEVYAALDWAKAYTGMLENDATRSRALARFAWNITTTGGAQGVQAAKTLFGTTLGLNIGAETNPPPVTGSAYIRDKSLAGAEPIRIAGAMLDPDHSRPARLMAAAALGLPETFFGDADVGNHATAKTLDRPTELRYSERRQAWRDVFTDILQSAIDADIAATSGILRGRQIDAKERTIDLSWPSLLERETKDVVAAIVSAATLDGKAASGTMAPETVSRLLLSAIGVDDVDSEVAKLSAESPASAQTEAFVEALRDLREVLRVQPSSEEAR